MITTCTDCGGCYDAGSEEQAYEPERFCCSCWQRRTRYAQYSMTMKDNGWDVQPFQQFCATEAKHGQYREWAAL
jgi:hypothetical protein